MAERLTKKDYKDFQYTNSYCSQQEIKVINQIFHKLGKLEDIMEKYGVESMEDLDSELQDRLDYKCLLDECNKAQHDRDTWKKACELVCKKVRTEYYSDYEVANGYGCNPIYFYKQAQEEKGNKND